MHVVNNIAEPHCLVVELEMGRISDSVTAEEGPRGRNILLLTSMPRELLTNLPHFKCGKILQETYLFV